MIMAFFRGVKKIFASIFSFLIGIGFLLTILLIIYHLVSGTGYWSSNFDNETGIFVIEDKNLIFADNKNVACYTFYTKAIGEAVEYVKEEEYGGFLNGDLVVYRNTKLGILPLFGTTHVYKIKNWTGDLKLDESKYYHIILCDKWEKFVRMYVKEERRKEFMEHGDDILLEWKLNNK